MKSQFTASLLSALLAVPGFAQHSVPTASPAPADKLADKLINEPVTGSWNVYGPGQTSEVRNDGPKGYPVTRVTVRAKGKNVWDVGAGFPVVKPVAAGDTLALAVYLRAPMLKDGETTDVPYVGLNESSAPYDDVAQASVKLTNQWKVYFASGKAKKPYTAAGITVGIHLASDKHVIDLGPVRAYDLGPNVDLGSLPKN